MRTIMIIVMGLSMFLGWSQEKRDIWSLKGHLRGLEMLWVPPETSTWRTMTSLENRLDLRVYPLKELSLHAGFRNIFNYGQLLQEMYPFYPEMATYDDGIFDLTWDWTSDSSYLFYTNTDRLNLKFTKGKFETTVGRQRINWGINLVWTPNDIFNSFNYFDFDYAERPGCDAILLEYYTGVASSVQLATKLDHDTNLTAALLYKFNRWNYDFQALGGVMENDVVLGAGWTGYVKNAGFTGEGSYFIDRKKFSDTNGVFIGSIGLNYTLKNGLLLNGSYLFNSAGTTGAAGWGNALALFRDISPKDFTLAKNSIFGQLSYPITPLIKGDLSAIFNPNDKSGYFGPSVDMSLTNNLTLLFISQIFWGNQDTEYGDYGSLWYLRLKWGF